MLICHRAQLAAITLVHPTAAWASRYHLQATLLMLLYAQDEIVA